MKYNSSDYYRNVTIIVFLFIKKLQYTTSKAPEQSFSILNHHLPLVNFLVSLTLKLNVPNSNKKQQVYKNNIDLKTDLYLFDNFFISLSFRL